MSALSKAQLPDRAWFASVPAVRIAILRIAISAYTLWYLTTRTPMLMRIAESNPALFRPIGGVTFLDAPLPPLLFKVVLAATLVAGVAVLLGWRFRFTGPLFALLLLITLSYRNSWSMIYHSHNIVVLHVIALAVAPASDALSLDARRYHRDGHERPELRGWPYAWPVVLISALTVTIYWLAGIAKIMGELGFAWAGGSALRGQIAVDAIRKEVFLKETSPLAYVLYDQVWLFTLLGTVSLVLELLAPLALADRRLGRLWAVQTFLMHWGIFFLMGIRFRYQMAGLIFLSFFDVERVLAAVRAVRARAHAWGAGARARWR